LLVETSGHSRRQQLPRVVIAKTLHDEAWQSVEFLVPIWRANRKHHRDPFCRQAPRDERQHLSRCPVQPLRIVDQADQRSLLGDVGQQAKGSQAHQEAVGRRPLLQAQHDSQGIALRSGKML
jgi:hypothetical protein